MKISKIIVENYRSIQRVEIELSRFGVFVGQNNHGKTNFFESIEWFYTAKSSEQDEHFNRDEKNQISVEIFFDDVISTDIEKLTSETTKTKISSLLGKSTSFSVVKTSLEHKRRYIVNGEDKGNPQGLDTAINEFLPKLEYINTKIRLDDVSKYKDKNPIGTMLSGVLTAIIESSDEYVKFKNQFSKLFDNDGSEVRQELDKLGARVEFYLQKQFPDGTKVRFKVNPPHVNDLLKSFDTTVDDGIETKAEDKGDGMQRAIMLSIIQSFAEYRKNISGGGTFLFLIDEAELHLHPSAQRALKKALLDICLTDQVLVNTHSSVLVVDDNENQKIFKVEKIDHITNIKEAAEIDKFDIIFELLGGNPTDLLLPANIIIVEGYSEVIFLRNIIKRFYPNEYSYIQIVPANGDLTKAKKSLTFMELAYQHFKIATNPYSDKVIVIADACSGASGEPQKYTNFKTAHQELLSSGRYFELPEKSLEEYYPLPYRANPNIIASKPRGKELYAEEVAFKLKQEEFETHMAVLHKALQTAKKKRFGE